MTSIPSGAAARSFVTRFAVVDCVVVAQGVGEVVELGGAARRSDDLAGAQGLGDLPGQGADAAGGAGDEHDVAGADLSDVDYAVVGGHALVEGVLRGR